MDHRGPTINIFLRRSILRGFVSLAHSQKHLSEVANSFNFHFTTLGPLSDLNQFERRCDAQHSTRDLPAPVV